MRQEDAGLGMANTAREGKDTGFLKVGDSWGIRLDQLDETDKKLLRSLLSAGWGSGQGRELVAGASKDLPTSTGTPEKTGDIGYGTSWGKSRSAEDDALSEISFQTRDSGGVSVTSSMSSTLSTPTTARTTATAGKMSEASTFRGGRPVGNQLRGGMAGKARRLEQEKQKQQGSRFDRSMRVLEWLDADCGTRLARHYEQAGGWRHTRDIMSPTPTFSASPPPNRQTEGGKSTPPKRSRQGLFIHLPKGGILAASAAQQHGHIVQHQLVAGSPRGAARPPIRLTRSHILSHTTDLWHGYVKDSEEESDSVTGGGSTGSASGSVGTPKKRALPEFHNQPKPHPRLSAIPRGFFAADGDTSSVASDDSFLADDNNILFDPSDDDDDDDLVLALRRWEEEQLAQQEALDEISMQEYVTSSEDDDDDDNENDKDSAKSRDGAVNRMKGDATKYEDEDSDSSEDELVKAIRAWQEEQEKFARLQQLQQQRRSSLVHQPPPLTPVIEEEKETGTSASNSPSWEPFGYFYRERNLLVYQVKNSPGGRNVPPHLLHQPYWWEDIGSVREGPSSPPVIAKHRKNPYPFTTDSQGNSSSTGQTTVAPTPVTMVTPADRKPKATSSLASFLRPQKPSLSSLSSAPPSSPSKLSLLPPPANAQASVTPSPTSSLKWTPPFLNLSSTSLHAPPNSPNPVASPMLHSPMCALSSPKPGASPKGVNKQISLSVNQEFSPGIDGEGSKTVGSEAGLSQKFLQSKLIYGSSTSISARSPLHSPRLGETPRSKQGGLLTPQPSPDPSTVKSTSSENLPASSPLISRSSGASGFSSLSNRQGPHASGDHVNSTFSTAADISADTTSFNVTTTAMTTSAAQTGKDSNGAGAIGSCSSNSSGGGRRLFKDKRHNQLLTSGGLAYASFDSGIDRGNSHASSTGSKSNTGSTGSGIDKIGEFLRKVGNKLSGSNHDHHHSNKNQDQLLEVQHQKLTSTASSPQVKQRHHSADNGSKVKSHFGGSWKLSLSSPSISPTGELSQITSPSFLKPPSSPLWSKEERDVLSPLHSPCVATKSDPMGGSAYVSRWQAGASWAVGSNLQEKQKQKQSRSDTHVSREEKDTLEIPTTSSIFRNLSADNINSTKDENRENAERWRRKTDVGLGGGNLLLKSSSSSGNGGNSFTKYSPGSNQALTNFSSFPSSPQTQQRTVISKQARATGGGAGDGEERVAGGRDGEMESERGPDSILSPGAHSPMAVTRGERKGGGWGEASKIEPANSWPGVLTDSVSGERETGAVVAGARKGKTNNQTSTSPAVTGNYQHQSYHFQNKQQQQQQQQQLQQQQQQHSTSNQISKVFLACGEAQPFVVPQSYHHSQHYQQQKQLLRQCHSTGEQQQQQQHQGNSPAPSRLFPRNNLSLASKTSDLLIPTPKDPEPVSPKPISDEGYKTLSGSTSAGTSGTSESAKSKKGFVRRYFTFDTESKSAERETPAYKSKGVLNSAFSADVEGPASNYTSSGIGVTARYTCHEEDTYLGKLKAGKISTTTASSAAASAYREAILSSRAGNSERSSSTSSDERSPRVLAGGGGGGGERGDSNTLAIPGTNAGRGDKDNGAGGRRSSHGTCNHLFLQQPTGRKSPLPPQQQEQQQNTKVKKSPSPVRSQLLRAFQNNSSSLSSNSSCGYGGGGGGPGGSATTPPISPPPHYDNDRHHSSSSSLETSPRRQLPDLPPASYRGRRKFSDTGLTPIPRRLLTDGRRGSLTDERTLVSAKSKLGKLRHQGRKSSVAALVKQIHNLWDDDDNGEDNDDEDCYNDDESDDERGGGKSKNKKKSSSRRPSGSLLCSFDDQILFDRRKKKFPLSLTGNKDKDKNSGKDAASTGQGSGGINGKEEGAAVDKKMTKKSEQGEGSGGGEVKRGSGGGGSGGADAGVGGAYAGQLTAKIRGGNLTSDIALGPGPLSTSSLSGVPVCAGTLAALSATASASREDPDRFHYLDGSSSGGNRINLNDVFSSSSCAVGSSGVSNAAVSSSSGALCSGSSSGGGVVASELVGPVAQVAGRQLVATAVAGAAVCLDCADSTLLTRVGHGTNTTQQHSNLSSASNNNGTVGQYSKGKQNQGSSSKKTATVQFQPIVSWDDTTISEKTPVFPALRSVLKQGARRHSSFAGFTESEDNLFGAPSPSPTNPNKGLPPTSVGNKALLSHQDSLGSALTKQAKSAGLPKSKTSDVFRSILKQPERPVVAHVIDSVGGTAGAVASCSSSANTTFSSINPQASVASEKKRSKSVSPKAKKTDKSTDQQQQSLCADIPAKGTDAYNKAALSLCLKASRSLSPKHKKSRALESGTRDSVDSTDQCSQAPPLSPYDRDHITDSGHSSLDLSSTKTVGVQVTPRTIGKTSNTGTQTSDALSGGGSGGCVGSDSGVEHSSSPTTGGGSSSTSSAGFPGVGEGAGWLHRLASKCMASVGGASRSGTSRGVAGTTGGGGGMCGRVGGGGGGASASTSTPGGGQVGSGGGHHPRTASVRAEWLLGSKRMGSSPSSPVAPANDASERFWVPQGVLARKRAQSLIPTLSKQESEEDLSSEAATPASIPHPRDLVFTFPGVTGDKAAGSGTGCSSDGQVTTPPSGYNAGRRRASMHDAIDLTKIDTRLYDKKLVRQASVTSIEEESQGTVHVSLEHNPETSLLTVNLVRAHNLQPRDVNDSANPYCRLTLLPSQRSSAQSRIHRNTVNPQFEEEFIFEVGAEEVCEATLEISFYEYDQFSKDECVGHVRIPLQGLDLSRQVDLWRSISHYEKPKKQHDRGDIMFSLSYLPSAERLTVVVVKARNLRQQEDVKSDVNPFIKVCITAGNKKLKKKKTSTAHNSHSPTWNEALVFSVNRENLRTIGLEVSAYHDNKLGIDDLIGKVRLPGNSEDGVRCGELLKEKGMPARWYSLS